MLHYKLLVLTLALISSPAFSGFTVNPRDIEVFVGFEATFECQFSHERDVGVILTWLVNGTAVNRAPSHACELTETNSSPSLYLIVSTLNIIATLECNNTDISCIAVWNNGSEQIIEPSNSAYLYIQEFEIEKATVRTLNNGTIFLSWDPVSIGSSIMRNTLSIHYTIQLFNDRNNTVYISTDYVPEYNKTLYVLLFEYRKTDISYCTTFTVFITPIINNEFSGKRTTVVEELQRVDHYYLGNVSFVDGSDLEFTYLLSAPIPFCHYNITAIDSINNETYRFRGSRCELGLTNELMFRVGNNVLPYNGHYMAEIHLSNNHSTISLQDLVNISTFDVQNVTTEGSYIVISFVQNSSAQGAFVVCSANNSLDNYNMFYYYVAELRGDTIEYQIPSKEVEQDNESYSNRDSLFVYDIESNGLLHNTKESDIRPASTFRTQRRFCVEEQDITDKQTLSNVSVNMYPSNESHKIDIVTQCSATVSTVNTEILGCVSVIHKPVNLSILLVSTITKENSTSIVTVEVDDETTEIYYVVLEWRQSGLIGSNELIKGKLVYTKPVGSHNGNMNPSVTVAVIVVIQVTMILLISVTFTITILILIIKRKNGTFRPPSRIKPATNIIKVKESKVSSTESETLIN